MPSSGQLTGAGSLNDRKMSPVPAIGTCTGGLMIVMQLRPAGTGNSGQKTYGKARFGWSGAPSR